MRRLTGLLFTTRDHVQGPSHQSIEAADDNFAGQEDSYSRSSSPHSTYTHMAYAVKLFLPYSVPCRLDKPEEPASGTRLVSDKAWENVLQPKLQLQLCSCGRS
jgi:hypothetical protein